MSMKPMAEIQGGILLSRPKVLDYLTLVKPELTFLSVGTTLVGYGLGASGHFRPFLFFWILVGTALVGGGAGALNQFVEREFDALMRRTQDRPLPAGRTSPVSALLFGAVLAILGVTILSVLVNLLTGFLACVTLVTYLFLYTPLKRITPLSTIVGAVPGALPPVMGWTAARNAIDGPAWGLFAVLFLWQMPHFLSLAWVYRKDYQRAGYRMLAVFDPEGTRSALQMLFFSGGLIPASVIVGWSSGLSPFFVLGTASISVAFTLTSVQFMRMRSNRAARQVFMASILYLLVWMSFLLMGTR
jgi:heme o synthase